MNAEDRVALVRRGLLLNYATISYNVLEAVIAIVAGVLAGSIALLGFGLDSVVEVSSSIAAQWRLRTDADAERRAHVERLAHRMIGAKVRKAFAPDVSTQSSPLRRALQQTPTAVRRMPDFLRCCAHIL